MKDVQRRSGEEEEMEENRIKIKASKMSKRVRVCMNKTGGKGRRAAE